MKNDTKQRINTIMPDTPEWLTLKQAAAILQWNKQTVLRKAREGLLDIKWPGPRSPRISAESVRKLMS